MQDQPNRTTADICMCGCPRHYHYDEDERSPVHKPGVNACMVCKTCVKFIPVGAGGERPSLDDADGVAAERGQRPYFDNEGYEIHDAGGPTEERR